MHDSSPTRRDGMALAMAMLAVVVIGTLIAGVFFASTQDYRVARNALAANRAFAAAERGLNRAIATWDPRLNLAVAVSGDSVVSYSFGGAGAATVHLTRVSDDLFWLTSEGRSADPSIRARRRTGIALRLDYPTMGAAAALTVSDGATVHGHARVSGTDASPPGWPCDAARDTAALAHAPGAIVSIDPAADVDGAPRISEDSGASGARALTSADAWAALTQRADVIVAGAAHPSPIGTETECTRAITNWGEPRRDVSAVLECASYFPIVWARAPLRLSAGRGQGILLAEAELEIGDDFEWVGLIVVKGDLVMTGARSSVSGAVSARHASVINDVSAAQTPSVIQYSSCAVVTAMRGSARATPVKHRAWAELW